MTEGGIASRGAIEATKRSKGDEEQHVAPNINPFITSNPRLDLAHTSHIILLNLLPSNETRARTKYPLEDEHKYLTLVTSRRNRTTSRETTVDITLQRANNGGKAMAARDIKHNIQPIKINSCSRTSSQRK